MTAEIAPDLQLQFWSQLPRDRIASDLEVPFRYRASEYEPGTADRSNCFEIDALATVRGYQPYLDRRQARLEEAVGCSTPWAELPERPDQLVARQVLSAFGWA